MENPEWKAISADTKALIDKRLLERVSLAGIRRVVGVSEQWLQDDVNAKYEAHPQMADVPTQKKDGARWRPMRYGHVSVAKLTRSAIDAETRMIVGCAIGPRDKATDDELWYALPPDYRQRAVCYTDFLQAYAAVLPSKRHKAVGNQTGKTCHIERLNHTFRQRCSRLVRKALSFSKKLANHIGAIWLCIHHYNDPIRRRLDLTTTS